MKEETPQVMIEILAALVAANQIQKDFKESLDNGFNMIEATLSHQLQMNKNELIKNLDILFSIADEPVEDRDFILNEVANSKIYNEVLECYIPNDDDERAEFKQYLFDILCTKPNKVIEDLWHKKQFMYWYVGIIRNSIISSTSPWHRKHRSNEYKTTNHIPEEVEEVKFEFIVKEEEDEKQIKLGMVDDAIAYHLAKNPKLKTEFDLFRMHFKNNLSYREISKMTHIPLTACYQYVQTALVLVKKYVTNKQQKIK